MRWCDCGVRVEAVPWAPPDAGLEALMAFLCQQMAKTPLAAPLRIRAVSIDMRL